MNKQQPQRQPLATNLCSQRLTLLLFHPKVSRTVGLVSAPPDAGSVDRRDMPSAETTEALEEYTLLCPDRNGWIELTTDGEHMWVEVERR